MRTQSIINIRSSLAVASLIVGLAGCGEDAIETASESQIVGGATAPGARFEAVGALVSVNADGTFTSFCTGALTYPDVVVTAKHCLLLTPADREIAFAIGADAASADRVVPIVGRLWERTVSLGVMSLGSDVAAVVLAWPINDITPVRISKARNALVGRRFLAVGYGLEEHPWDNPNAASGNRRRATVRLRGVNPGPKRYWRVTYDNDFAAFFEDWTRDMTPTEAEDPATRVAARAFWDGFELGINTDALVQRGSGTTAPGDSGGPLLRRENNRWVSYGATSGAVFLSGDSDRTVSENFTVYSTFGREAKHFVRSAKRCGAIPQHGQCFGRVLARCSGIDHGLPEVLDDLCAQSCVEAPAGAQCAPGCSSNSDCNAIAANGTCEGGACQWSDVEKCTGEPGEFSCLLCCLGANGGDFEPRDLAACSATCFPPSASTTSRATVTFPGFPEIEIPVQ